MKETENKVRILNREYFHFLISQHFEHRGQASPSAAEIDKAIERIEGLVKRVLECSFNLSNFKDIAQELNLTNARVQQLYSQGLRQVVFLLERQAENREASINENN
jgi:DNA-directed RNA polymerase specialized sigma subunit